jgi:hypothetical protein
MAKRSGLLARSGSIQAAIIAAKGKAAAENNDTLNAKSEQRGKKVGLTLRLDERTHDRLRKIAFEERVSIHSLLLEGVETALGRHEMSS